MEPAYHIFFKMKKELYILETKSSKKLVIVRLLPQQFGHKMKLEKMTLRPPPVATGRKANGDRYRVEIFGI